MLSQKVPGLGPDEVIEFFFNLPDLSSRIMALGFTQSLAKVSTTKLY
jgi:hypothetical protein